MMINFKTVNMKGVPYVVYIDDIIKSLEEEMAQTAKELEFERAGELRDQIKELKRIALY